MDKLPGIYNVSDIVCEAVKNELPPLPRLEGGLPPGSFPPLPALQQEGKCTTLGKTISDNLVRVAASRIFADPYQSILELPVNSIDSYNRLKAESLGVPFKSVGKFGMGFFSILYWVLKNPQSPLIIESVYVDGPQSLGSFTATITADPSGEITVSYERKAKRLYRGTTIRLNGDFDTIKFQEQLYKLFDVRSCRVIITDPKGIKTNVTEFAPAEAPVVNINFNIMGVYISDDAEGITPDVLFNSLLVPSSSSKGLRASLPPLDLEPDHTRILTNGVVSGFFITVGEISVYADQQAFGPAFVLNLPLETQLPVSRDDVIVEVGHSTARLMRERLRKLINQTIDMSRDVTKLFAHLRKYVTFSQQGEVSNLVSEVINEVYARTDLLLVPKDHPVYPTIQKSFPLAKFVTIEEAPLLQTEERLSKLLEGYTSKDVFVGKQVVKIKGLYEKTHTNVSSGGLTSFIFVDQAFAESQKGLSDVVTSFNEGKLVPYQAEITLNDFRGFINRIDGGELVRYEKKYDPEFANFAQVLLFQLNSTELYKTFVEPHVTRSFRWDLSNILNLLPDIEEGRKFLVNYTAVLSSLKVKVPYGRPARLGTINTDDLQSRVRSTYSQHYASTKESAFMYHEFFEVIFEAMKEFAGLEFFTPRLAFIMGVPKRELEFDPYNKALFQCRNVYERIVLDNVFYAIEDGYQEEVTPFLVQEIQRRFTLEELSYYIKKNLVWVRMGSIEKDVYEPLYTAIKIYTETLKKTKTGGLFREIPSLFPQAPFEYNFTARNLLSYVYSEKLPYGLGWLKEVTKYRPFKKIPLQSVEIAINEGTTKNFVYSVLTELVQNSVDAIRSAASSTPSIEVTIGSHGAYKSCVAVKDPVGISPDGILSMMIPFYSTKSSKDSLSTGEMGSGFFNVYRQPWARAVIVETMRFGKAVRVVGQPMIEEGRVVDVWYSVSVSESTTNGTSVIVVLNENSRIASTLTDAFVFSRTYLPTIDTPLILNGNTINIKKTQIYSSSIGTCYMIGGTAPSTIQTNGIPFSDLFTYLRSAGFFGDSREALSKFSNSVIINLSRSYYTPVQARNRIVFPDDSKRNLVRFFFEMCLFEICIYRLNKFGEGEWFTHLEAHSPADQVKLSPGKYLTTLVLFNTSFEVTTPDGKSYRTTLGEFINEIIGKANDKQTAMGILNSAKMDESYKSAIKKWLSNKTFEKTQKIIVPDALPSTGGVAVALDEVPQITKFVRRFWEIGYRLEKEGLMVGPKFSDNPPSVYFSTLSAKGQYQKNSHTIILSIESYPVKDVKQKLQEFAGLYKKNRTDAVCQLFDLKSDPLYSLLSNGNPAKTLIHELSHAWRRENHEDAAHGDMKLTLRKQAPKYYTFDEAALEVYKMILENGLIDSLL